MRRLLAIARRLRAAFNARNERIIRDRIDRNRRTKGGD